MERPLSKTERRICAEIQDENKELRKIVAAAQVALDDAGVGEVARRLDERVAILLAEVRRLTEERNGWRRRAEGE